MCFLEHQKDCPPKESNYGIVCLTLMPRRNVLKVDVPDSYYHVYARGNNKLKIFRDKQDYSVLLSLLKRYLSAEQQKAPDGYMYPSLSGKIELLCFCLMPNHFHLLLYQKDEKTMETLMRGVMTSYSLYFNKRYKRTGTLFESRYKASLISQQSYLEHITRYIHLNPTGWQKYPYSSLPYYLGKQKADWILPKFILDILGTKEKYIEFLKDCEDNKHMLDKIKHELANTITT